MAAVLTQRGFLRATEGKKWRYVQKGKKKLAHATAENEAGKIRLFLAGVDYGVRPMGLLFTRIVFSLGAVIKFLGSGTNMAGYRNKHSGVATKRRDETQVLRYGGTVAVSALCFAGNTFLGNVVEARERERIVGKIRQAKDIEIACFVRGDAE